MNSVSVYPFVKGQPNGQSSFCESKLIGWTTSFPKLHTSNKCSPALNKHWARCQTTRDNSRAPRYSSILHITNAKLSCSLVLPCLSRGEISISALAEAFPKQLGNQVPPSGFHGVACLYPWEIWEINYLFKGRCLHARTLPHLIKTNPPSINF